MIQGTKLIGTVLILATSVFFVLAQALAQTPQETLNQYISDLQKNPNDYALREKIIKHVQTTKLAPAIPEEAERYMARGTAAAKGAKNPNDFKDAVREFEKATLVAPWLANAYYNLGVAQDGAGMYAEAIKSLKLYLLAVPNASDAKKLIYEIEYRQEKAAKESSPAAVAEKKQNEYDVWLKNLNGARFDAHNKGMSNLNMAGPVRDVFDIQGEEVIARHMLIRFDDQETASLNPQVHPGEWREYGRAKIINGQFTMRVQFPRNNFWADLACTINRDGTKVTCVVRWSNNVESSNAYYRSMEP